MMARYNSVEESVYREKKRRNGERGLKRPSNEQLATSNE
jgi:hypothetical protein